jgi:hypothetical protein
MAGAVGAALVGLAILMREYRDNTALYSGAPVIGMMDLTPLMRITRPEFDDVIQRGGKVALVGEAAAFRFVMPLRDLKYRTVFDIAVDEGPSYVDAWLGPEAANVQRDHYTLIEPAEVKRLCDTYQMKFADFPAKGLPGPRIIAPSGRRTGQ